MGKQGELMTDHGTGNNNSAENKLNNKGKTFTENVANRIDADIKSAKENDMILIKNKINELDPQFCLFCSQIYLGKYVYLVKIEEGYYGCPDCNFTKVTQDAYDKFFKNNKEAITTPESNQNSNLKKKEKKLKEKILDAFKSGPSTIEEISKETNIDRDTIRAIINRNLKNKYIKETGEFKNKFKVYVLIDETETKQERNRILKDLKKGFKSYTVFFEEISKRIGNNKTINLEEYKTLLVQYIDREFIKSLNKKLQEEQ